MLRRWKLKGESSFPLNELLNSLLVSPFWSPMPCREAEISFISEFMRRSFSSEMPRVLVVLGDRKTGKTSALNLCASMSLYGSRIRFVNSPEFFHFRDFPEFTPERNLVVFDNFNSSFPLHEIVEGFARANYSMVFVSAEPLVICEISIVYCPSVLNFGRYSSSQFVEILKEKIGVCSAVPQELLAQIAAKVSRSRGTVPDAVAFLVRILDAVIAEDKVAADRRLPDIEEQGPEIGDEWVKLATSRIEFIT
jgi:hypothetical protein